MSRLDDELRQAFRRERPSDDFTERVLKAVAAAPPRKRSWWVELLSLMSTPKVRLVAVGVAASLLIVLWAVQSQRLKVPGAGKSDQQADVHRQVTPAPDTGTTTPTDVAIHDNEKPPPPPHQRAPRHPRTRSEGQAPETSTEIATSEGEVARERLMLALHIASASLNEAQRMVKAGE